MEEDRLYRKHQNMMAVCGQGIILLCAWGIAKVIMYMTMDREYYLSNLYDVVDEKIVSYIAIAVLLILLFFGCYIQFKIGMAAIKVARGGSLKIGYYALIVLFLTSYTLSALQGLTGISSIRLLGTMSALMLDLISVLLYGLIIFLNYKIYKYRKNKKNI